jgi:hypothetical protein
MIMHHHHHPAHFPSHAWLCWVVLLMMTTTAPLMVAETGQGWEAFLVGILCVHLPTTRHHPPPQRIGAIGYNVGHYPVKTMPASRQHAIHRRPRTSFPQAVAGKLEWQTGGWLS